MSATSQVPSSASAARIARAAPSGSVMSCRQSNVVTKARVPSAGSGRSRGSWNSALVRPDTAKLCAARSRAWREMS